MKTVSDRVIALTFSIVSALESIWPKLSEKCFHMIIAHALTFWKVCVIANALSILHVKSGHLHASLCSICIAQSHITYIYSTCEIVSYLSIYGATWASEYFKFWVCV